MQVWFSAIFQDLCVVVIVKSQCFRVKCEVYGCTALQNVTNKLKDTQNVYFNIVT